MFGSIRNDATGYNCDNIENLRGVINSTAQNAGTEIVDILHSEIIVPMSTVWYAPEAQEFFEGFASTVASSGEAITSAFDAFRAAVQDAGTNWADNTGGKAPSLSTIDTVTLELNVSEIQADNGGNVTIDGSGATKIASNLSQVEGDIKEKLRNLSNELNAETAFIGGEQATALQDCFTEVSGAISTIFKYLTNGEDSLQGQINKAVQKYTDVSSGISSAFKSSTTE